MGQAGTLMMNSMKRFVKQRESNQPSQPALRDDAASRAVYRVARHPDVLDVLAPILQISRQKRRREMHPEEISPQTECCHRPEDQSPVTAVSANSAQIRRRTRLLRTGEEEQKKARRKTNGP